MFGCGCGFVTVAGNAFSWNRFFRYAAKHQHWEVFCSVQFPK
jgi:hypothetical protein